ncbi:MAG TPA: hypothetical protein VFX60_15875, partial [Micromonospora sp.]|nr:hypothetical protein [Micromonospora sp.]
LESCPGYAKLGLTAWRGYLYQVGHWLVRRGDNTGIRDIAVKAERYPGRDAAQLMQDVRRVVQACPEFGLGNSEAAGPDRPAETWVTYQVLKNDFAGDSSVLVRSVAVPRDLATGQQFGVRVVTLIAVVQVGDLVTTVSWYEGTPEQMTVLAQRAVPRLCTAARPRC